MNMRHDNYWAPCRDSHFDVDPMLVRGCFRMMAHLHIFIDFEEFVFRLHPHLQSASSVMENPVRGTLV